MNNRRSTWVLVLLSGVMLFSLVGLLDGLMPEGVTGITGHAVESTSSQVVIQAFLSIALSDNLSGGIDFGSISTLPAIQLNATGNYNVSSNETVYFISVSNDSNTNVDFCIRGTTLNTSGGDDIGLGNYTWDDNASFNNFTIPEQFGIKLNQTFVLGSTGVTPNSDDFYRFWLNISASQAPGTYNNTVFFQGVPTGDPCT